MPFKSKYKNRVYQRIWGRNWRSKNRKRVSDILKKYRKSSKFYKGREKRRLAHNKRVSERYRKTRLLVIRKYGGEIPECKCCGEKTYEFLSIDHINGRGNQERKDYKPGTFYKLLLTTRKKPKQYQVLCYNCNMAKGFLKICPHKKK